MPSSRAIVFLSLVAAHAYAFEPERDAWLLAPEPSRLDRDARPRHAPLDFSRVTLTGNDKPPVYARDAEAELIGAVARGEREQVEKLLAQGANPNRAGDVWGKRALPLAVEQGDVELTRILLDAGADPNLKGNGFTPLVLAALKGQARIAELLLCAGADPDLKSGDGNTPLIAAALMGHTEVVRVLLPYQPDFELWNNTGLTRMGIKTTAPGIAAFMGHTGALELMLAAGADPNFPDREMHPPLFHAVYAGQRGAILLLLQHGAEASTMSVDAY